MKRYRMADGSPEHIDGGANLIKNYTKTLPGEQRPPAIWTLGEIVSQEAARIEAIILKHDPSWTYGKSFDITHTKEEEQQYGKELIGLFEQLKQNPFDQAGIWNKVQNTMVNYATNGGGSQSVRGQVLAGAGDSFLRMENCWSLLLKRQ
ncbi:hypothetical protein AALB16_08985 [Lachnospiraceae bacterium 62-35]